MGGRREKDLPSNTCCFSSKGGCVAMHERGKFHGRKSEGDQLQSCRICCRQGIHLSVGSGTRGFRGWVCEDCELLRHKVPSISIT